MNIKCINGRSSENKGPSDSFSCCSLLDDCTFPLRWDERPPRYPAPPAEITALRLRVRVPGFCTVLPPPAALPSGSNNDFKGKLQARNPTCHQNFLTLKT